MTAIIVVLIIAALFGVVRYSFQRKTLRLARTAAGATRVETVKASLVDLTVRQYARAGWTVVNQSSAKSFGSQARVTITFRKG